MYQYINPTIIQSIVNQTGHSAILVYPIVMQPPATSEIQEFGKQIGLKPAQRDSLLESDLVLFSQYESDKMKVFVAGLTLAKTHFSVFEPQNRVGGLKSSNW